MSDKCGNDKVKWFTCVRSVCGGGDIAFVGLRLQMDIYRI